MVARRLACSVTNTAARFASTSTTTTTATALPVASTSATPIEASHQVAADDHEQSSSGFRSPQSFVSEDQAWSDMLDKVIDRRMARYTADVFEKLGSTQNRSTTWQPHHTLHRPPTAVELTTSHLVASGAHLGHSPATSHRSALPQVYGIRAGTCYIDLRQTLPALRRAAQVVKEVVERDGSVVFVGSLKGTEKAVMLNARRLGENGFGVTKWLAGTISNAKEVFSWSEVPQDIVVEERRGQTRRATSLDFKPSLLILLSPTLNQHALREATANQVPTIGITDTDVDPRLVTYAIPANDDSRRTVELIAGVLGMAGKEGLERKRERLAAEAEVQARKRSGEFAARQLGRDY
ncbi:hypothetical protein OIO90_005100 [Microbotryomycetes sp. JL221]|nr:hypothetical protein OIO90_005100 [Microbotryomycetes sp. JL221]